MRYWGAIAWQMIDEAIESYDSYMLDGDFDANSKLREIIETLRRNREKYLSGSDPHQQ